MLLNLAADLGRRKDEVGRTSQPVSLTHTPSLCCMGKNVRFFQCMGLILIWYLPHLTFLSLPPPLENGDIISLMGWCDCIRQEKGLNMGQFRLIKRVKESRQTWAQIPSSATSNHVTSRKLMLLSLSSV